MKNRTRCLAGFLLALSLPAPAHEFWLWPSSFAPAPGTTVSLSMMVGEYFNGEPLALSAAHAAALRVHARGRVQAVTMPAIAGTGLPRLPLSLGRPGAHLVAFDSQPSLLTLSADRFHAYLHDEGLDAIIAQREQAGVAGTPGRERFRRHVKTLLAVGGNAARKGDSTCLRRTGQTLEILPLADPLASKAGDTLGFRIVFRAEPLVGSLVKAWHKRDGQTVLIRARTNVRGDVRFTLPHSGPWMISVVHMTAADDIDADWESYWGNLTFALAADGTRAAPSGSVAEVGGE